MFVFACLERPCWVGVVEWSIGVSVTVGSEIGICVLLSCGMTAICVCGTNRKINKENKE